MKPTTTLLSFLATFATTTLALPCVEYSHVLQESFVGTNSLLYYIYLNGEEVCSAQTTSTEWADATFEHTCNDDWRIELNIDAGENNRGEVFVAGHWDSTWWSNTAPLNKDKPDKQFGCGGETICVGVEYAASASFNC